MKTTEELRKMELKALQAEEKAQKHELAKLRISLSNGTEKNNSLKSKKQKYIAQIMTVKSDKSKAEQQNNNPAL